MNAYSREMSEVVTIRFERTTLQEVEQYARASPFKPSRSTAIRALVISALNDDRQRRAAEQLLSYLEELQPGSQVPREQLIERLKLAPAIKIKRPKG
jgi:metal-responsive CopG/Arc/MetJ family transcriptional regulator